MKRLDGTHFTKDLRNTLIRGSLHLKKGFMASFLLTVIGHTSPKSEMAPSTFNVDNGIPEHKKPSGNI